MEVSENLRFCLGCFLLVVAFFLRILSFSGWFPGLFCVLGLFALCGFNMVPRGCNMGVRGFNIIASGSNMGHCGYKGNFATSHAVQTEMGKFVLCHLIVPC
jgi:hypothetical protein